MANAQTSHQECIALLNLLRDAIHDNARAKGFQDPPQDLQTMGMNTIGEILEQWESYRAGTLDQPCDKTEKMMALFGETLTNQEEEAADQLIRVLDMCGRFGIDISRAVRVKMAYNSTRPQRHGGKRA
jgi:NTP pyrophosphatase (non-canonical NTP hydrolase)